jgi:uncharacterized protein YciI
MGANGVLAAAGPFDDQPVTISGIFVFRSSSLEEAQRIASMDPTVVEHRSVVEVVPWRAPRGIGEEYKRLHDRQPDLSPGMGVQPLFLLYRGSRSGPEALSAHDAYIDQLRTRGLIGAAGRTEGRDDLLSIVVFNRIDAAEAARLMAADPAVTSGALRVEAHRWWCAEHVLPWKGSI